MELAFSKFTHSLPVQLLFNHLKKNLILIFLWIFFIASVVGGVGRVYGIHYLFLDPEYLNEVSFASFFWVGLAFGNFTMAFHITTYILDGHKFQFIGILEKPFGKYTLNNSIIPIIVLLVYIIAIIVFQIKNDIDSIWVLMLYIFGLIVGFLVMHALMFLYFHFTNKDIFKYLAGSVDKRLRKSQLSRERVMDKYKESKQRITVDYYLDLKLRLRSCTGLKEFYDKESVLKVFDQNHFNSVILELIILALVLLLGFFLEKPWAQIPAASSTLLLFSLIIMLIGAISYWFREWGVAIVLGLFILSNFIAKQGWIGKTHPARGIDYQSGKAAYSINRLQEISSSKYSDEDTKQMIFALNQWKKKQGSKKPKLPIICVSGGGQRAALWTVNSLLKIDQKIEGEIMDRAFLITGASGGMIGAAYYRANFLNKITGKEYADEATMLHRISKDNLNSIIFSLVVNDTFFKFRNFKYNDQKYLKDRGYIFEENLNNNLGGILDLKLKDYQKYTSLSKIPLMLLSPVVSNDGRKLYLSSLNFSFMVRANDEKNSQNIKIRGSDFNYLFEDQNSQNLNFLSALRMSASFPYITPTISLPSEPRIEVMDAGIADNFGISDALRFIYVFKDWIEKETSGVVLITIRDTRKLSEVEERSYPSLLDRFTNPIASVYNNLANIQDIRNDSQLENAKSWLNTDLDVISFEYDTYAPIEEMNFSNELKERQLKEIERASLSWHLTKTEKKSIVENIDRPFNRSSLQNLVKLLD
jgi:hypothetical protein